MADSILSPTELAVSVAMPSIGRKAETALLKSELTVDNNWMTRIMINDVIAEIIWLSVIAEAKIPIEIKSAARKKKTTTDPHAPMLTTPPQHLVTIM